jgi:hypothetical protein
MAEAGLTGMDTPGGRSVGDKRAAARSACVFGLKVLRKQNVRD